MSHSIREVISVDRVIIGLIHGMNHSRGVEEVRIKESQRKAYKGWLFVFDSETVIRGFFGVFIDTIKRVLLGRNILHFTDRSLLIYWRVYSGR